MLTIRSAALAAALAFASLVPAAAIRAQPQQPPADALTDPALKGPEVIAFIGVKPGARVADVIPGRFVRALSQKVGPKGKLYAVLPADVVKAHPEALNGLNRITAQPEYANVEITSIALADPTAWPKGLDAVFIRQNYHDLHDKILGPVDVPAFNRAVYAALKPGGVFVVLDHAAPGTGLAATETLHRIDPAAVKAEVTAAGFKFDGESAILANPADPHDKLVFDPSIRGHTDQFLYRFKKPG